MHQLALLTVCVAALTATSLSVNAQEHRELGPHVHGAGTLKIAIDADKVELDFSAPANDIIGFEHAPSTPEQRKILADAKATLAQPLDVFTVPAAAGCHLTKADVVFNAAEPAAAGVTPAAGSDAEHQHADFDVDAVLTCAAPKQLRTMSFPYFQRFANAQKLTVTIVSDAGQAEFDVTRDHPTHDLP